MKPSAFFSTGLFLLCCFSIAGCGSGVPAEATGDPVPVDYQEQQMKAQEEAMKKATGQ